MKRILLAALAWAVFAGSPDARAKEKGSEPIKGEIAVGEVFAIKLPCIPTTGYNWELKSINRRIAIPTGPAEFQKNPGAPGKVGAGGHCVIGVKGVKPGKAVAILAYRRSWEKGEPAKTATAEITVVPKKAP